MILTFLGIFLQQGQTALSIAEKLGYISVVETLKVVTETIVTTTTTTVTEEKFKVVAPETMQEAFISDSEDEAGKLIHFTCTKFHKLKLLRCLWPIVFCTRRIKFSNNNAFFIFHPFTDIFYCAQDWNILPWNFFLNSEKILLWSCEFVDAVGISMKNEKYSENIRMGARFSTPAFRLGLLSRVKFVVYVQLLLVVNGWRSKEIPISIVFFAMRISCRLVMGSSFCFYLVPAQISPTVLLRRWGVAALYTKTHTHTHL